MKEPIYTLYPDRIEYASFGGHVRTREYVENWPFVSDDGKKEVFAIDGFLPYSLHPFFAVYLPSIGCKTLTDVQERVTNKDAVTLQIDLSPTPLGCGVDASDFARYLRTCIELGVAVEQVLNMVEEAVAEDAKRQLRQGYAKLIFATPPVYSSFAKKTTNKEIKWKKPSPSRRYSKLVMK